jgi:hypothetical protein
MSDKRSWLAVSKDKIFEWVMKCSMVLPPPQREIPHRGRHHREKNTTHSCSLPYPPWLVLIALYQLVLLDIIQLVALRQLVLLALHQIIAYRESI